MSDKAIEVIEVNKTFKLPYEKSSSIKNVAINFYKRKRGYNLQEALKNITLDVNEGEFLGIVGRNGSGKSTLLKLLAGIYNPTSGIIRINGRLTPFIELGVGFSPELTGRENVYLNGALLGFSRKEMRGMYEDIVNFAELKKFMDQKLKNYSSGMQVRLAFSIATRVQSDILVLDEVLAVGDAAFQRKCYNYFMHLKKQKKTVVLVTHDMEAIRQYCDRAIMIDSGMIVFEGSPENVSQAYQRLFTKEIENDKTKLSDEEIKRWGNEKVKATKTSVVVDNEKIFIHCSFKAKQSVPPPVLGFSIRGPAGNNILEGNTFRAKFKTKELKAGNVMKITWSIPNMLKDGRYDLTVAICDQSRVEFYDWYNEAASFDVTKEGSTGGIVDPNIKIEECDIEQ